MWGWGDWATWYYIVGFSSWSLYYFVCKCLRLVLCTGLPCMIVTCWLGACSLASVLSDYWLSELKAWTTVLCIIWLSASNRGIYFVFDVMTVKCYLQDHAGLYWHMRHTEYLTKHCFSPRGYALNTLLLLPSLFFFFLSPSDLLFFQHRLTPSGHRLLLSATSPLELVESGRAGVSLSSVSRIIGDSKLNK